MSNYKDKGKDYARSRGVNMNLKNKIDKVLIDIKNKFTISDFAEDNRGMGVVEVILIIVVLVGLAVIFKSKITSIVNTLFSKLTSKISTF